MTLAQKAIKRTMDVLIAGVLIIILSPLFLLISVLIRLQSGPGVIFRQKRVGKDGKIFTMYKFRSMIPNAEKMGAGIYFSGPDDPRLTKLGILLRNTSIDELPQLFNVLKGEMSLIGPRPPLVQQYASFSRAQRKRFAVKPGITGWAQVTGRHNHSWSQRIQCDIWYIENYSIRLDLLILLKTIKVVLTGSGIRYVTPAEMEDFSQTKDDEKMQITLSAPDITDMERQLVMEVLSGNQLSMGPMLENFEKEFAAYIGAKHAVAVNSGTSGLHLLVRALGFKPGDEVITTPFSFVASANCLLFEKVTPVFADIDPQTLNIDVDLIEAKITPRTRGILPVHVFGVPVQMNRIKSIADKYNLKIIEDSCEAIGAEYEGRKVGTFGEGGVFAFYPNKQMTCGEGGMIVTDNDEIAAACRSMRNQGRGESGEWLSHDRLGYNYRLDEMSAALGLGQIRRIEELLEKRNKVAAMYRKKLAKVEGVHLPYAGSGTPGEKVSWFVFVVRLEPSINRSKLIKYLKNSGIDAKPYFKPIHLLPFYRQLYGYRPGDFPVTEQISNSTLALPFHNNLTENEVSYIVEVLKEGIAQTRKG